MDEPVRIPTLAEMPRIPAAQMEADADFFCAYVDLVGAVILVHDDGTEGVFMSVPVGEAFLAAEAKHAELADARARTAVLDAESIVLGAELRRLEKEQYRLTHPLWHRCEVQRHRGAAGMR
ncbi:hypothetical protein [Glycomyces sp. MUSA5-2]|uniref:hypothetical protein n=1 Tax=Glycomyces sp. MUSA5-2 TaxID=2053002 RepID=UPI00300876EB